jgi:hypothetical protein
MADPSYWLDLFTWNTWREFLKAGGHTSGFRENRWAAVQKMRVGDYLLCYLTGISRFIGILEVTGDAHRDETRIWGEEIFPCRIKVKVLTKLTPEVAVPISQLRDKLSMFQNLKNPNAWVGYVRGSPVRWKPIDGAVVLEAVRSAKVAPVARPFDAAKLLRKVPVVQTKTGPVTIPEEEAPPEQGASASPEVRDHTEIQKRLLQLEAGMGLDVFVARNDRSALVAGTKLGEMPRVRQTIPTQFETVTQKTIELIDVLWLRGNAIVAAFEVESTTNIHSGLLRMSDLISTVPNIEIPLYIVAPDQRREKVISEINRPTFRELEKPLPDVCRFIAFSSIREAVQKHSDILSHLKPDYLEEISETCALGVP